MRSNIGILKCTQSEYDRQLLPSYNEKHKTVPQVSVSTTPEESRKRDNVVGFSLMYTCGEKRQIVVLSRM